MKQYPQVQKYLEEKFPKKIIVYYVAEQNPNNFFIKVIDEATIATEIYIITFDKDTEEVYFIEKLSLPKTKTKNIKK